MKELSIEKKAKRYDEAIERAEGLIDFCSDSELKTLEYVFPELKESEDERIRKNIISWLKNIEGQTIPINDYNSAIAWLEKQSRNPYSGVSFEYNGNTWGMCARDNGVDILLDKQLFKHLEKQDMQKEINLIEILKHYPKETELYSPLYGKLWLAEVDEEHEIITCYKHPLDKGCTRAIIAQEDTVSFFSNGTTGLPDYTVSKDCMLFLYDIEKQSKEEQNKFAKGVLSSCALSFINYLDAHKYEGKMCVSNAECEDIENAFHNAMWDILHRYYCKYIKKQDERKWSEEDEMMCTIAINACEYANDEFESFNDNYEKAIMWLKSLKKLMKE